MKEPQLKQTTEYRLFESDRTNRSVRKLNKLLASMRQWGFLPAHPIATIPSGTRMIIRDGQHRFEAAKQLKIPLYYVCTAAYTDVSIPEINSASVGAWNIRDYMESFCNQGNVEYAKLRTFCQQNEIQPGVAALMLCGTMGSEAGRIVREGRFTVKDMAHAQRVMGVVNAAAETVSWAKGRNFVGACSSVLRLGDVSADDLATKIRACPSLLRQCATTDDFLGLLEEIYNYRLKQRVPLKFLAQEAAKGRSSLGLFRPKKNGKHADEPTASAA